MSRSGGLEFGGLLLGMGLVALFFLLAGMFFVSMMATTEQGVNVSGTPYESTFNSTRNATVGATVFMQLFTWLVPILALLGVFILLIKMIVT